MPKQKKILPTELYFRNLDFNPVNMYYHQYEFTVISGQFFLCLTWMKERLAWRVPDSGCCGLAQSVSCLYVTTDCNDEVKPTIKAIVSQHSYKASV